MDRRRGLLQDNAIFYFDFSTSQGSYHELIESLKLRESPVRSLDIRCIDFDQLSVDPLLEIIRNRSQLQRVMLTYPENWPTDKAADFCESVSANPNIETVWLSEIQASTASLRTMLRGLVHVRKLLVSMDQLRGNPTVRLATCTTLRDYVLYGNHLTLCDVRFNRDSFEPIAGALKASLRPPTLEFRWCSFDAAATELLQQAYTQGARTKRMSIGFESIRNPFPNAESIVYGQLLASPRSSIAKLKLDTFLKGSTDFSLTLQAIADCSTLTHLSLWNMDSQKCSAVAQLLPHLYQLRQFAFSVSDTVALSVMLDAVSASMSLVRVCGDLPRATVAAVCQRNIQCQAWVRSPPPRCMWPTVVVAMEGCVHRGNWVAATLLQLGEEIKGPSVMSLVDE